MDIDRIPKAVMGVLTALIVIVSVAVPILSGLDLSQVATIEGYDGHRYAEMGPEDTVIIGFDGSTPYISINGDRQAPIYADVNNTNTPPILNVIGANFYVNKMNQELRYSYIMSDGTSTYGNPIYSGSSPVTITYDGENGKVDGDLMAPGKVWIMVDDGEYADVSEISDMTIPVSNAAIMAAYTGYGTMILTLNGSDVVDYSVLAPSPLTGEPNIDITIADGTIAYPESATLGSTSYEGVVLILAPYEVDQTPAMDKAVNDIIDVMPLIMVVGVLVAVVSATGLFILNRRS